MNRQHLDAFHRDYYNSHVWQRTFWLGVPTVKYPTDLIAYQEILFDTKPDLIVECGTHRGGTTFFFATLCQLLDHGRVLSIDPVQLPNRPTHPRLTYLQGSSTAPATVAHVKATKGQGTCMVVLDSDHRQAHVSEELRLYAPLVSPGHYLIVEDTNVNGHPVYPEHGSGPWEAVAEFLAGCQDFERVAGGEKYFLTANPGGYLRKKRPPATSQLGPEPSARAPV
jgi:cephalosporin hydroxylase